METSSKHCVITGWSFLYYLFCAMPGYAPFWLIKKNGMRLLSLKFTGEKLKGYIYLFFTQPMENQRASKINPLKETDIPFKVHNSLWSY